MGKQQVRKLNPRTLLAPPGNKHAHVVIAPPGKSLAFIAGQVAFDVGGQLVGPRDYYAQLRQCFENLRLALEEIDAHPDDIVKMTIYVRDYQSELLAEVDRAGTAAFGADWPVTATTLIGVQALGMADFLVEIEAIAVIGAA